jgi:hypothetical protein
VRLRFLGKHSSPGNSPTLWDTDAGQYVIQGFGLDADTMAQVGDIPPGELVIRVPKELMRYLPEARHDADDDRNAPRQPAGCRVQVRRRVAQSAPGTPAAASQPGPV